MIWTATRLSAMDSQGLLSNSKFLHANINLACVINWRASPQPSSSHSLSACRMRSACDSIDQF